MASSLDPRGIWLIEVTYQAEATQLVAEQVLKLRALLFLLYCQNIIALFPSFPLRKGQWVGTLVLMSPSEGVVLPAQNTPRQMFQVFVTGTKNLHLQTL